MRVKAGGSQTFHFLPDEGFALSSVEVNGQPVAVLGLSYTLGAIMANASIAATFEPVGEGPAPDVPQVHSIEATSTAGGTVSPSGSVQVPHGGSMSFAFIPYAGYELDEVHVDGQPHAEAAEKGMHRFDNVVHDEHAVHAVFKAKTAGPDDPVVTATAARSRSRTPATPWPTCKTIRRCTSSSKSSRAPCPRKPTRCRPAPPRAARSRPRATCPWPTARP